MAFRIAASDQLAAARSGLASVNVGQEDPSLFVFSINGSKQNARSLLTPDSYTDFFALLCGSLHFVLYGSSNKRLSLRFSLAVEEFEPIEKCYHGEQIQGYHVKEHWKL